MNSAFCRKYSDDTWIFISGMNTLTGPHEIIFLSGVLRCHALFYIKDKQSDETTWNQRLRASTEGNFSQLSLLPIKKKPLGQHQQVQLESSIVYLWCGYCCHSRVLISHTLKSHPVITHIFLQVIISKCSIHKNNTLRGTHVIIMLSVIASTLGFSWIDTLRV